MNNYPLEFIISLLRKERNPNVLSDNNGSERVKRNVKVKQKISGQFNSKIGVENFMVLRSITDTALKNDQNVLRDLNYR